MTLDLFKHELLQAYYSLDSNTKAFPGKNGILKHSEQVVNNFNIHFRDSCLALTSFPADLIINLLKLHDIGKGLSNITEDQYKNSVNIIKQLRHEIGLSKPETNFICTMIENEAIGELFKSFNQQYIPINNLNYLHAINKLNLAYNIIIQDFPFTTKEQLFNLMCIYYCSDASSYPFLVNLNIFTKDLNFHGDYSIIIQILKYKFLI